MTDDTSTPQIILGGGSSGGGSAGTSTPGSLAIAYQNLLSGAADLKSGTGSKVLVLTTGNIGMASGVQVGNTETEAEQQENLKILGQIASFCRANNIGVQIDAVLTNPATYSSGINALTDQWAVPAADVGLPIVAVQDVNEIGACQPSFLFAPYARIEANAVKTLIQDYAQSAYRLSAANLTVGDMECEGAASVDTISQWWQAYNTAAAAAGVPSFSFVTADTGLFAPWIAAHTQTVWQNFLASLSQKATSNGMALNVIVQGVATDLSGSQIVQEAEQNAINIAKLQSSGSLNINALTIESWNTLPVGVGQINSPTSSTNEAAEISAVYPLYQKGVVTAQNPVTANSLGQIILNTGSATSVVPLSLKWSAQDLSSGNRMAVVLIDQTGSLTAQQHGGGTVSNSAGNILVLSGNASDLTAELGSIKLLEPTSGPDTIDIQTYGSTGRLTDNQVSVYATVGKTVGALAASNAAQGWLSSSAVLNKGTVATGDSVLVQETLYWSTSGTVPTADAGTTTVGQSAFINVVGIHEPLAEYGVEIAPGSLLGRSTAAVADVFDPSVDNPVFTADGYANNQGMNGIAPGQLTSYLGQAFNPMQEVTAMVVASTTQTFDPSAGQLETLVNRLAPDPITVTDRTGIHADTYANAFNQGGYQVIQINTGTNPNWQMGWGNQFSSVTMTYDAAGQLVEEFLQGASENATFSIDNVFDPFTGRLWEQFQSSAPPPASGTLATYATTSAPYMPGFSTGPVYVTQFNTGNNPNWDYIDWGSSSVSNTEVWTDYLLTADFNNFVEILPANLPDAVSTYPLQFVNGSTLDLIHMAGSINVNLNSLSSVTIDSQTISSNLSQLETVDAWAATGTVSLTGLSTGHCTLIGGDTSSTITGFGSDTIVAGGGFTSINSGNGHSSITITSATGTTHLFGSQNTVTAISGSSLSLNGTGNIITGNGINISVMADGSSANISGNNNTITVTANNSLTISGNNDTIVLQGSNVNLSTLSQSSIWVQDTAAGLISHLDELEAWANAGTLRGIYLTDIGVPRLTLSTSQLSEAKNLLRKIVGPYTVGTTLPVDQNISSAQFSVTDMTNTMTTTIAGDVYTGPVADLQYQCVDISTDSLNITANVPNVFLRSGSGMDGLNVSKANGNNILDGSTGSNFLTGGTGDDTFYLDDLDPTTPVFSTIVNFHFGDNATVWGVNATDFTMLKLDNQGAVGYTGLDLIFTAPGHVDTSFVLAGYTSADLTNGRLSMSYGKTQDILGLPGSEYLTIHAN